MACSLLSVLGRWHAVGEGDGERVQGWFPPYGPPCLTGTFRVERPGDQVQALHRGLLGREVSAGLDRPAVSGVQALDGVRGANDQLPLDVVSGNPARRWFPLTSVMRRTSVASGTDMKPG